jgi:hypothetical protein
MRIPVYQNQVSPRAVPTAKTPAITAAAEGLEQFGSVVQQVATDAAARLKKARIDDQILDARLKVDRARSDFALMLQTDSDYAAHEPKTDEFNRKLWDEISVGLTEPDAKRAYGEMYKLSAEEFRSKVQMNAWELEAGALGAKSDARLQELANGGDHEAIEAELAVMVSNGVKTQEQAVRDRVKYHHIAEYNNLSAESLNILIRTGNVNMASEYVMSQPDTYLSRNDKLALVQDVEQKYAKVKEEARGEQMKGAFDLVIDGEYDALLVMIQPDIGEVRPGGLLWALTAGDMENLYAYIQASKKAATEGMKDDYADPLWEAQYTAMYLDRATYDNADLNEYIKRGLRDGKVAPGKARTMGNEADTKREDDMNDAGVNAITKWIEDKVRKTDDPQLKADLEASLGLLLKTYKMRTADPKMTPDKKRDVATQLTQEAEKNATSNKMRNILSTVTFGLVPRAEVDELSDINLNLAAQGKVEIPGLTQIEAQHRVGLRDDKIYAEFIKGHGNVVGRIYTDPTTGEKFYSSTGEAGDWWKKDAKGWMQYDPKQKVWIPVDKKKLKQMWKTK